MVLGVTPTAGMGADVSGFLSGHDLTIEKDAKFTSHPTCFLKKGESLWIPTGSCVIPIPLTRVRPQWIDAQSDEALVKEQRMAAAKAKVSITMRYLRN